MVGPLALRLVRHAGPPVPERGVAPLRVVPAPPRQRGAHLGEAGPEEVGIRPGLPELRAEHPSALALSSVLTDTLTRH